jgi:type II secretory pathway pseudopilin PulG
MGHREQHEVGAGEQGFILLAVLVLVAILLIVLAVAAPVMAKDLRRDKEVESEHRAQQYVRAIQLFYRKNNAYPPTIKALENTNNVRYLRQQYVDPLTGKADWRLIHMGEQKTTIKGFFGKELAGLPGAGGGLGSAAGMQSPGATAGTGSTTVSGTGLGAGFNGAQIGGSPGSTGSTGSSSSGTGMFGDSAGGGAIVGVGTSRTGDSILTPNGQTTYETWEFWYDPRIELLKKGVSILGGGVSSQPASGFGNNMPGMGGSTGSTGQTTQPGGPGVGSGTLTTP